MSKKYEVYSATAVVELDKQQKLFKDNRYRNSSALTQEFSKLLKKSPKFILPELGRFGLHPLNEDTKHLVKLPFPSIVLEYANPTKESELVLGTYTSTKRIVLAFDSSVLTKGLPIDHTEKEGIYCFPISYIDKVKKWVINWVGAFIPTPIKFGSLAETDHSTEFLDLAVPHINVKVVPYEAYNVFLGEYGLSYADLLVKEGKVLSDQISIDLAEETSALLDFLTVINCGNVHQESVRTKTVLANIKDPKTRFDYKILTLDVAPRLEVESNSSRNTAVSSASTSHSSPREHVRRGHFRHYANGKSIWINDQVIAKGSSGKIEKTYKVKGE